MLRLPATLLILACAAAVTAAAQPIGAHSGEIVEVPVWLSTAPHSDASGATSEGFELHVNGKVQPIPFLDVWRESAAGALCILGFYRDDDEAGKLEVTFEGGSVQALRGRGRFGPALHDHYDGMLLGITSRDGLENGGVPLQIQVSPFSLGAYLSIGFPSEVSALDLPPKRDHGEGLYVCIINEWGDRLAFSQRQLFFDPIYSGHTGFRQWYTLPKGNYIARAFMTLQDTVIGFTRTDFTIR